MAEPFVGRAGRVARDLSLLFGVDVGGAAFRADPYRFYARALEAGPVHRLPGGTVTVLGHRAATRVLRDPRFGHGATALHEKTLVGLPARSFMQLDAPGHTRLRRRVAPRFSVHRVAALEAPLRRHVGDLVDGCAGRDTDFVAGFAEPLAMTVISEVLGVPPRDRERFRDDARLVVRGLDEAAHKVPDPAIARARYRFVRYFQKLALLRRREPGDDLVSLLAGEGGAATGELVTTCGLLLSAGYETIVDLLGSTVWELARAPEPSGWRLAEHPDAVEAVVEEALRMYPPVQCTLRGTLADVEIAGLAVPAGTVVCVVLAAANRDPAVHADPHAFRPERHLRPTMARGLSPSPPHLAFGGGPHFCLGAALARLEARTALTALAPCRPELTGDSWAYKENLMVRGLDTLPVRWRSPARTGPV
ncbi:cytochrome P450 [Streptomyces sp. NPDC046261]|uniref:cytochrome P450 n=1 Tax=Streptomyces sp. NPDC046261 TaxID=3157200 RepID=UPI0033DCD756